MFTSLQLYLLSKFQQNEPKQWKSTRNILGRHVQVQLINILCSLNGRESRYFEEILNPQKSVCGRISTFLMFACVRNVSRCCLHKFRGVGNRDDNQLLIYAYFYCMSAALSAVQISRRLSNLFHDVKFLYIVARLLLIQGKIVGLQT